MGDVRLPITDFAVIRQFFLTEAKHGTAVTIVSVGTGVRYTFEIRKDRDARAISILTGPDNERDYRPLARILSHGQVLTELTCNPKAVAAVKWLVKHVVQAQDPAALAKVQIFAENKCARCGRRLTTPTSVQAGLGPECLSKALGT